VVFNACNPSYSGGRARGSMFEASQAKLNRPYLKKQNKSKRAGSMVQVVQKLSGKSKALSSNSGTPFPKSLFIMI
jgi:hypothetical protein